MTRKVFIGVLAALMLFAFVACDNTPVQDYGYVVGVTAETSGYFLEGETPNVSEFSFYKEYSDFTREPIADVENIVMGKVTSGKVSFSYNGMEADSPVSVNIIGASSIDADSFKVSASDAETEYYAAVAGSSAEYTSIDKTGLTATFEYTVDGVKYTKTVGDDMLVLADDSTTVGSTVGSKDVTVELNVSGAEVSDTYEINVLANGVKGIEADVEAGYVYYITPSVGLDATKVGVNLVYDSGERIAATPGTNVAFDTAVGGQFSTLAVSSLVPTTAGNFVFYAKYTGND